MSNLIFVDQPTGTGFSYSTDLRDLRYSEKGVSNDLYDFLQVKLGFTSWIASISYNVHKHSALISLLINQL